MTYDVNVQAGIKIDQRIDYKQINPNKKVNKKVCF